LFRLTLKYIELVLDYAETILSPFVFNRKNLGIKKTRGFLEELRLQRNIEVARELESLMK
jgi:hypothetical protein